MPSTRTLTASIILLNGAPFSGMLRITPAEQIAVGGNTVAVKSLDVAVTAGVPAAPVVLVAPGRYSFALLEGGTELQCFQAVVPEGSAAISLYELYRGTFGAPSTVPGLAYLVAGSSVLLLAPGGGTDGQVLRRVGGALAWADAPSGDWNTLINVPTTFPPAAHTHPNASGSAAGFMAAADKTKLDGIAVGAQPGTVMSVGLSMPGEFTVGGAPVTGGGTIAITKANQAANMVYAGPASGGAAAPGFRALVAADLPARAAIPVPYYFALMPLPFPVTDAHTPAAPLELGTGPTDARQAIDLTAAAEIRFSFIVTLTNEPPGAAAQPQYSADGGTTWVAFHSAAALDLPLDSLGRRITGWEAVPPGARADVLVRVAGFNGGPSLTCSLAMVRLEVR